MKRLHNKILLSAATATAVPSLTASPPAGDASSCSYSIGKKAAAAFQQESPPLICQRGCRDDEGLQLPEGRKRPGCTGCGLFRSLRYDQNSWHYLLLVLWQSPPLISYNGSHRYSCHTPRIEITADNKKRERKPLTLIEILLIWYLQNRIHKSIAEQSIQSFFAFASKLRTSKLQ